MNFILQNNNTFRLVCTFTGKWKPIRCLNRYCKDKITDYIFVLYFSEYAPKHIIQTLSNKLYSTQIIVLFKNKYTNDSLVSELYRTCTNLKYLYLDYCDKITSNIFINKPQDLQISCYGCWRTQHPDTTKKPEDVVEIQMWCFQYIHDGGYAKMLEFVSEYYHFVFMNSLKRQEVESLMNSSSFSIQSVSCYRYVSIVQIQNIDTSNCVKRFEWILNRINDHWLTTNIMFLVDSS